MTSATFLPLNRKQVEKTLNKSIKEVMAENSLKPSTRKGNKELSLYVKQIATASFSSLEQVKAYGKQLGQEIVDLSQEKGKNYLDIGVVRQIAINKKKSSDKLAVTPSFDAKPTTSATQVKAKPVASETEPEEEIKEDTEPTVSETALKEKSEPVAAKATSASISLKDRISEDIKQAMKAKDKIRLETVRSIKKAILEKEVEIRPSGQEILTPEQELDLLSQQAKQRRDSIEQYEKAGRNDLAEKEAQELEIIETYLPKQLSEAEISTILDEIIASVGATSPKDMGKVMGPAMQQLKGKADGKQVQSMVKDKLN